MNDPRLRTARPADLAPVLGMIRDERLLVDGIEEGFGDGWVVAHDGDRLVGCAAVEVHGSDGLLRSVAVDEEYRGTGLGRRLVGDRIAWAGKRGLRTLSLLTLGAAGFFAHLGFREIERTGLPEGVHDSAEYAHGECASARAFTRRLD